MNERHPKTTSYADTVVERLQRDQTLLMKQWANPMGTVTRSFFVDELLPVEECNLISASFPSNFENCRQLDTFRERKKTLAAMSKTSPIVEAAVFAFQDKRVIEEVQRITGMTDLLADPKLYAGGISMMGQGDFLNPHIDNSHNADRSFYRRLNLLYYSAPNWALENGGNLELWDNRVRTPKVIESRFNRLVVMETNAHSWHSVSPVVVDQVRQCVSNYYFSERSPSGARYYHVTSFLGRPNQPLRRLYGSIDNKLRNFVAQRTGLNRGKNVLNDKIGSAGAPYSDRGAQQ